MSTDDDYYDAMHEEDYLLQEQMRNPVSFLASKTGGTMYYDQAMRQPDAEQFSEAAVKEVNSHTDCKHWEIISRDQVPHGHDIIPAVWSMRRKRDISTGRVTKYKARLNIHGGMQEYGVNYFDTFSPVATWSTIILVFILSLLNGWYTRQVDWVLAYPQADVEYDLYMNLPPGFKVDGADNGSYVLKILKNVYGLKDAGRTWWEHLTT